VGKRSQQADVEHRQFESKTALTIDFWKARCKSAEMEQAKLKKMNTALTVKLGELIRTDRKLETEDIETYEARILALEEEISSFRASEQLAISDAPDLPNDMILDISWSMKRIASRLRRSFEGQEFYPCPRAFTVSEDSQLQRLCAVVLNLDVADATIFSIPEVFTRRLNRQTLLRALSAAALAEWVFHGACKDILFDRYDGDSTHGLISRYGRALKYVAGRGELTMSLISVHSSDWDGTRCQICQKHGLGHSSRRYQRAFVQVFPRFKGQRPRRETARCVGPIIAAVRRG
jgi:hypothetical protein